MSKTLNDVASIEKAISKKYGSEAVVNPKSTWDDKKEKDYIEQLKKVAEKENNSSQTRDKIELNGFLLSKKLINKTGCRVCPVCDTYSFDKKDDLYMNRFECCFKCYIGFVEGREERWKSGWRPPIMEKKDD